MGQIIFKISVLFTFCLLIIVVKKAEIVLTLINDTGKVLDTDFRCCNDHLLKCGKSKKNPIQEKQIKKPPKYQKNFLFDSDVKFPEFIIFGVKKCGTG